MQAIDERLQEIAREVFGDEDLVLTDSTVAGEVPGWDSLAHVNFVYSIEEAFGVQFSEEEFTSFEDVGGLKRMLEQKVSAT